MHLITVIYEWFTIVYILRLAESQSSQIIHLDSM